MLVTLKILLIERRRVHRRRARACTTYDVRSPVSPKLNHKADILRTEDLVFAMGTYSASLTLTLCYEEWMASLWSYFPWR
jgi:hypothetical protein